MNLLSLGFGPKRSLRRRLMISIIIALTLCVVLAGAILIKEFGEHLKENIRSALFLEAEEVLGQVEPEAANFGLNPDALRFAGVQGAYRYTVFDGAGNAVVGGETSDAIWAQLLQTTLGQAANIMLPGDRVGVGLRAKINGVDVFVLASTFPKGTNETQLQTLLHEIKQQIWWIALGVVVILAAAQIATRSAVASLDVVSRQAHLVGPIEMNKRLSADEVPTEIQPLIRAVNGAFDRLEQGYQAQRDFSSNVAHEIRTPLAVLRSGVDRIRDAALQKSLDEDLSRLDRMFEQLINLARADASVGRNFAPLSLRALVLEQAGDLAGEALRQGRMLGVNGVADVQIEGHAGLLGIALRNLIHNALRYAPKGSEVEIEVTQFPPGFRVIDHGPGVPDALKTRLFDRFNRGKAEHQNDGSGIGLAIVQSVARAHGAQALITDRPGGGSIFSMIWPETPQR